MKRQEKLNSRHGVVEGNRHLDGFCYQVLDLAEHGEVVLGLDVVWIGRVQARDERTEGCDAHALADSEDG